MIRYWVVSRVVIWAISCASNYRAVIITWRWKGVDERNFVGKKGIRISNMIDGPFGPSHGGVGILDEVGVGFE